MKWVLISLIPIIVFIISGCTSPQVSQEEIDQELCQGSYFEYKTGECCLDTNSNHVCDKDEKEIEKEEVTTSTNLKEDANKVALLFASTWEKEDYESLYDFFTPELQSQKTKEEFVRILIFTKGDDLTELLSVRLDNLEIIDDSNALAYYRVC